VRRPRAERVNELATRRAAPSPPLGVTRWVRLVPILIVVLAGLVVTSEEGTKDYIVANNGLFALILLTTLVFIVAAKRPMALVALVSGRQPRPMLREWITSLDGAIDASFLVAMLALVFVLDLRLWRSHVTRIGVVAALVAGALVINACRAWARGRRKQ
jgi:hypothetical protein